LEKHDTNLQIIFLKKKEKKNLMKKQMKL